MRSVPCALVLLCATAGSLGFPVGAGGLLSSACAQPADAPKLPPDPERIAEALRQRFGEAVRAVRVEVEDDGQDVLVRLRGEVSDEAIRDAVMQEVIARVERLRFQDF